MDWGHWFVKPYDRDAQIPVCGKYRSFKFLTQTTDSRSQLQFFSVKDFFLFLLHHLHILIDSNNNTIFIFDQTQKKVCVPLPCGIVNSQQRFGRSYYFHLQGKTIWRHNPHDLNQNLRRPKNHKPKITLSKLRILFDIFTCSRFQRASSFNNYISLTAVTQTCVFICLSSDPRYRI